jgi:hypothetical protein
MSYPLEVHPVPDEFAEHEADAAGLPLAEDDDECQHCESRIGRGRGQFRGYVIVLNQDDDFWLLCTECSAPVTDPNLPE